MELADYLGRIWRRKWIVLGIMILALIGDVAVLYLIPRQYQATAVLESGGIESYLKTPGQVTDTGRQPLPSTIQPITEEYLKILSTPSVSDEAKQMVQAQLASADTGAASTESGSQVAPATDSQADFQYTSHAEFVSGSDSDMVYIDVTSNKPEVAKAGADALANVLLEQSKKLGADAANNFIDSIQKEQIDPIDAQLKEIDTQSEQLKAATGGDVVARNVTIANLDDQAKTLEDTRKQYTDLIGRVQVNEALNTNNLRMLFPAMVPSSKEKPALFRNGAIASIVGLLVGVMSVIVIDRRKGIIKSSSSLF